jgi:hypothetical protein
MRRPAFTLVAALGSACLSGFAFADLSNPYYANAHASYVAGDLAHACPDLMTYRQQDRAFLERPENQQLRQQIDEVVKFCESRRSTPDCPVGYVCRSSGPVAGGPPPGH